MGKDAEDRLDSGSPEKDCQGEKKETETEREELFTLAHSFRGLLATLAGAIGLGPRVSQNT